MPRSAPVDGFQLSYDRAGSGPPVVLLHGWPGDRRDFRHVVPLLTAAADVITVDLRGFGESDKHLRLPAEAYSAAAQARSVAALIAELGLRAPLLAGYDVGSRVAQAVAKIDSVRCPSLVVAPPLPGPGQRVLTPQAQREFWYQPFHQLELSAELVDGRPGAVRAYLRHFWSHWSGPGFTLAEADLDYLVGRYSPPGAFTASIGWYRAGSGTVATALSERPPAPADRVQIPVTVLWPEHDPLFPRAWSDRLGEFLADVDLRPIDGAGHFVPLEAPAAFAAAILDRLG
jgi:pimeloyl-ACP methyl ester carboxylesterase